VDRIEAIDVVWPDGTSSRHAGGGVDRVYRVDRPASGIVPVVSPVGVDR
jgi:hypothetical protein